MSLEISKEDNVDTAVPQLQLKIEDIESDDDDDFDDSGAEDEDVAEEDIIGDGEVDDGEIEDEDVIDGDEVVDIDESKDESDSEKKIQSSPSSLSEMLQIAAVDSPNAFGSKFQPSVEDISSDDETDENNEDYLKKLSTNNREDYILQFHPEQKIHNYNEVEKLSKVSRDKEGNIIDPFHKTTAILTRYEKTKVLGQRAKQIDSGCKIFVNVQSNVIDGYLIATEELKQKKLPFIIRRPIPNGGVEYWPVKELDIVN